MDKSSFHKEPFTRKDYIKTLIRALIYTIIAYLLQILIGTNSRFLIKLSNAFLFAGALLLTSGAMSYIKREGFFDVSIVGFQQIFYMLDKTFRGKREMRDMPNLQEYKEEKLGKRRVNIPNLIIGFVFILISLVIAFFV